MPSSSSSSSSSSSMSSSSSCSSSSYHGFVVDSGLVEAYGRFEIISHTYAAAVNTFLINSGVGYDGYGNRLLAKDRTLTTLSFPSDLPSDGHGEFGYLCVRRSTAYIQIDYMDNPLYVSPNKTKYDTQVEFYISNGVIGVTLGTSASYYPPLDSNGVIEGLVLGKVYKNAVYVPDMITYRSPLLTVKDGTFLPLRGFNLG